jgi:hypothetical protein
MIIMGGDPRYKGNTYVSITVTNRGNEPTTITNLGLKGFDTIIQRWFGKEQFAAIINHALAGYTLPGLIAVGSDWRSLCHQTAEIEDLARRKLLYVWISHTFSDKLLLKRVLIVEKKSK